MCNLKTSRELSLHKTQIDFEDQKCEEEAKLPLFMLILLNHSNWIDQSPLRHKVEHNSGFEFLKRGQSLEARGIWSKLCKALVQGMFYLLFESATFTLFVLILDISTITSSKFKLLNCQSWKNGHQIRTVHLKLSYLAKFQLSCTSGGIISKGLAFAIFP